mmetsp:Transcript_3049/g.3941  ORF Transcript_3049/g.3941 Transcript_3049/m.3941 type:complete len:87 (+) Transcript_3049:58-318(+)
MAPPKSLKVGKKKQQKFVIDCWQPVEDSVLDVSTFEKFLTESIKVDKKTGNLGDSISVATEKTKVIVTADIPLSKRYLKYLTKKVS